MRGRFAALLLALVILASLSSIAEASTPIPTKAPYYSATPVATLAPMDHSDPPFPSQGEAISTQATGAVAKTTVTPTPLATGSAESNQKGPLENFVDLLSDAITGVLFFIVLVFGSYWLLRAIYYEGTVNPRQRENYRDRFLTSFKFLVVWLILKVLVFDSDVRSEWLDPVVNEIQKNLGI
jgi:hypothetical protein